MVPYMRLRDRIIAWLLYKFNGWSELDECASEVLCPPECSRMAGICRDYWYVRNARRFQNADQ